ncbi:MAG TPA: hypothetical protein V6C72_09960, partial [Chroococcales cyanobacterium]
NESDIRSLDSAGTYWTPEVSTDLNRATRILGDRARQLSEKQVPVLTSDIPQQFGLVQMNGQYAVLGHQSGYLNDSFLRQLSLIESPNYSVSASMLTPDSKAMYYGGGDMMALVSGPSEHVSQAYRTNLGTGVGVDWQRHVKLSQEWAGGDGTANAFAEELNQIASDAGVPSDGTRLGNLSRLRQVALYYDSLDEIERERGAGDPYVVALKGVNSALTTDENGIPLGSSETDYNHSEIKLNNPTFVGLGIIRNGRPVVFDGMTNQSDLDNLLNGQTKPDWLIAGNDNAAAPAPAPGNSTATGTSGEPIHIPESTWRVLADRDLPTVVLDP